MPLLKDDRVCEIVVETIEEVRRVHSFKLLAYVIMPEHLHLIIVPREETKVGYVIGEIKRISSRRIHKELEAKNSDLLPSLQVTRDGRQKYAFWQRRCFDYNCRTEESVWDKIECCHDNPVSRRIARSQEEWMWSSYRWYLGHRDVPLRIDSVQS